MGTLATEFNQSNLTEVSSLTYSQIERAIKQCRFLAITKDNHYQGSKRSTLRYIDSPRKYLTVSHYVKKQGGGLTTSFKVDKDLLETFNAK